MNSPLQKLLFSSNAQKILWFFLEHPFQQFYDREVARQVEVSTAGCNFALRSLAKVELLLREKKGRMFFYSLDEKNPLLQQLRVVQNITLLQPLVQKLKKHTLRFVFFGSSAKGENREESDLDIFLLTREKSIVEEKIISFTSKQKIQPIIHTPQEWIKLENSNPVFVKQVEEGLVLWSSPNES